MPPKPTERCIADILVRVIIFPLDNEILIDLMSSTWADDRVIVVPASSVVDAPELMAMTWALWIESVVAANTLIDPDELSVTRPLRAVTILLLDPS